MALEQIRVKQEKLREYMQLYGRANLYKDYIQFCADARVARKEARIKAEKRRDHIKDIILKIILGILIATLLTGVIGVLIIIAKKERDYMTAFMLACYLNGALQGAIYFKSVNDCTFYSEELSGQQLETENGTREYKCICKLVPKIDEKKVRIY